jgi:hypothetical protein
VIRECGLIGIGGSLAAPFGFRRRHVDRVFFIGLWIVVWVLAYLFRGERQHVSGMHMLDQGPNLPGRTRPPTSPCRRHPEATTRTTTAGRRVPGMVPVQGSRAGDRDPRRHPIPRRPSHPGAIARQTKSGTCRGREPPHARHTTWGNQAAWMLVWLLVQALTMSVEVKITKVITCRSLSDRTSR